MSTHQVSQGECLSSIAEKYGLSWKTIWDDPKNSSLRRLRQDPNVLAQGDELFIPEIRIKTEDGPTDAKHKFVKIGVPARLKIQILDNDRPRANVPYILRVQGCPDVRGTTDGDGFVTASIPPVAQSGEVIINEGGTQDIYPFNLGTVDPLDSEDGVRGRLGNLGYAVDEDFGAAVRSFQKKAGIEETGIVDDNMRQKLKERFGE